MIKSFRRRNANPDVIPGYADCDYITYCGGGCAALAYLYNYHITDNKSLFVKDPYCLKNMINPGIFPNNPVLIDQIDLAHKDYLCTWIGKPK